MLHSSKDHADPNPKRAQGDVSTKVDLCAPRARGSDGSFCDLFPQG